MRNSKSKLYRFIDHNRVVKQNLTALIKTIVGPEGEDDVFVVDYKINDGLMVKFTIYVYIDDIKSVLKSSENILRMLSFYSSWYGTYYFYEIEPDGIEAYEP